MRHDDQALRSAARLVACAGILLAACAPEPEAEPAAPQQGLQHLLATGTAATLGPETRLCTGPAVAILLYDDFESAADLPEFLRLPEEVARGKRVALTRRVWAGRPDGRGRSTEAAVQTAAVAVDRTKAFPRARLRDLGDIGDVERVSVQVAAFALADGDVQTYRVPATLPPGAVLEFGFGIREEAWGADARRVRFQVALREGGSDERILFSGSIDPAQARDRRWFDRRVDLAEFAGRSVSLAFRSSREPGAGGFSLPVWSSPVVFPTPRAPEHPNVLLISLDTLRARSLGAYGYTRDTSPFLDSLAQRGSLFENAVTASVTTSPSHMSLITGLYPVRHGIRAGLDRKLPHAVTLAQRLRDAGYRTAAFTENGYLVRRRGFGDGFDRYTENRGETATAPGEVRLTFGQARRWLEANRELPFFLFLHTYEVHSPYDPEEPYAGLFRDDAAPGPADPAIRAERDRYDREIRSVDDELRKLFDTLDEIGLAASTIVVVLADHGEEFAEHGGYQHGAAVYEESLRVPLLFWGPGRIPEGRHGSAVSLIDVAPTLVDLLGLPVPDDLDGTSLTGVLLRGEPLPPRPLISEARARIRWIDPLRHEPWAPPLFAVRTADGKFIVHRPEQGEAKPMVRFDLAQDPGEHAPLPVGKERARAIDALVTRYLRGAIDAPPPATRRGNDVSPDLRQRLRALGYLE
jgi:arylsulfatase A-like enzyme